MDIKEYLEEKDCIVQHRGTDHVSTHCVFCEEDKQKAGRLYINIDESSDKYGVFFCFLCHAKGGINVLREHFGDPKIKLDSSPNFSNPIFEIACKYYEERLMENPKAYKYLTDDRGFYDSTIREARLGWADGNLVTHLIQKGFSPEDIQETGLVNKFGEDFFNNEIIIPYLNYGIAFQLRGKNMSGKYRGLPGAKAALYGTDHIIGETTNIVTEGEFCALHLHQLGFPAVGVPGANTWKLEWNELFEESKRTFLMYDADKPGKTGAENVSQKLGPKTRIVELPKKGIDVEDYIVKFGKNADDIDYLLRKARGGLLISVSEAFERWLEIEGNDDLEGIRFNVPRIDQSMTFGLLPGQVMTMIARTNSGKSIMSINFFERMRMINPDIKILYVSLEQTRNEWFERAYRIHNFYHPGSTVAEMMQFWGDSFYLVDKNRISEEQLVDSIEQFSYETDGVPDFICVDYLGYYARGVQGGSEYDRITNAIMGLKSIAKDLQTVIYAPHQANRSGDMGKEVDIDDGRGGGTVEETSDLLLTLWNPDQASGNTENKGEVYQKIKKSRNGGVNTLAKYQFAPLTLAMVPIDDPLYERAIIERQYAYAGDNWQQAVERHKTGELSI